MESTAIVANMVRADRDDMPFAAVNSAQSIDAAALMLTLSLSMMLLLLLLLLFVVAAGVSNTAPLHDYGCIYVVSPFTANDSRIVYSFTSASIGHPTAALTLHTNGKGQR